MSALLRSKQLELECLQAYVLDQSVHLRPQSCKPSGDTSPTSAIDDNNPPGWRIGRHTPDQNASAVCSELHAECVRVN